MVVGHGLIPKIFKKADKSLLNSFLFVLQAYHDFNFTIIYTNLNISLHSRNFELLFEILTFTELGFLSMIKFQKFELSFTKVTSHLDK